MLIRCDIPILLVEHAITGHSLLTHNFYYSSYMLQLHKPVIIKLAESENVQIYIYTAVAIHMVIRFMAEISLLHKMYVNVTFGKHFYNI